MPLPIHLDHQATTPTDPRVVEAMAPWWTERFGYPSTLVADACFGLVCLVPLYFLRPRHPRVDEPPLEASPGA